jgi:subtilisin family serine protease
MLRTATKSIPPMLVSLCLSMSGCSSDQSAGSVAEAQSEALSAPQTYLVLYRFEAVPRFAASDIARAGGQVLATYSEIGVVIASSASDNFGALLSRNPFVEAVAATQAGGVSAFPAKAPDAPLPAVAPTPTASDPLAGMQWNMDRIRAPQAHAISIGKKSVIVGVLDSGIDDNVPDLQGQVDHSRSVTCIGGVANTDPAAWSFDGIGHGTHVSGIIAAKENGVGTVGVAPGVTLAAVKLTDDGFVYPEAFICGMHWAATHGFDLVNASIFTDPWYYTCSNDPTQRAILEAEQRAVNFAARRGVTVIAASSNEQQDLAHPTTDPFSPTNGATVERTVNNNCKVLPVELDGVIGVSATANNGAMAYYSNYGFGAVDLTAPGGDFHVPAPGNESGQIVSPIPSYSFYYAAANGWNGRIGINCSDGLDPNDPNSDPSSCEQTYALLQGTSLSTPHVTGVAALAISRYGKMPTPVLAGVLALGAEHLSCPPSPWQPYPDEMPAETCEGGRFYNGFFGAGEVDALAAVR